MAPLSKEAQRKFNSSKYLGFTISEHRDRIIDGFVSEVGARGRPVVEGMLDILGDELGGRREKAHAKELRLGAELADDDPVRMERDEAVLRLGDLTVRLDGAVTSSHGEAGAKHLGLTGRQTRNPDELLRLGKYVLQQLPTLPPPAELVEGLTFDPAKFTPGYRAAVERLDAALLAVGREGKEADAARVDAQKASEASDRMTVFAGAVASALFTLFDEPVLARKTRMGRRPGVVVGVEEDEPEQPEAPAPGGEVQTG